MSEQCRGRWLDYKIEGSGARQTFRLITEHVRETLCIGTSWTQFIIWRGLLGNKIADHSDVVGASPVSAAPTTSSFSA